MKTHCTFMCLALLLECAIPLVFVSISLLLSLFSLTPSNLIPCSLKYGFIHISWETKDNMPQVLIWFIDLSSDFVYYIVRFFMENLSNLRVNGISFVT